MSLLFFFITVFILLYSVISNVSYSRLRIYCLIHTPLSPLSFFVSPPGGGPSVIHTRESGKHSFGNGFALSVYSGYSGNVGEEGTRREPPSFPPSEPLFPHPWSTTSTGNSRHPTQMSSGRRGFSVLDPRENGSFFLGDGLGKITARNEEICG